MSVFSSVLTGSLQSIAERPLPCNYNVIQFVCALSRRRRGFESRRGRQFNSLGAKASAMFKMFDKAKEHPDNKNS